MPLRSISAKEVGEALMIIFTRTGLPLKIVSDQGSQFVGSVMSDLCKLLGIDKVETTPYHPQGNGLVERFHGSLKPMLAKAIKLGVDWVTFLPLALFALQQVPNRETGFSPHQMVYGENLRGPLDLMYSGWVKDALSQIGCM